MNCDINWEFLDGKTLIPLSTLREAGLSIRHWQGHAKVMPVISCCLSEHHSDGGVGVVGEDFKTFFDLVLQWSEGLHHNWTASCLLPT